MCIKKIAIVVTLLGVSCSKVEPIEIIAPERDIDTALLTQYKTNLENRNVSVGMLYGWGVKNESVLMKTPDSLDIIVVKDGYDNLTEYQKQDLSEVRQKKATKVFIGLDFLSEALAFQNQYDNQYAEQVSEKEEEWKASSEALTNTQKQEIITKIGENISAKMISELNQKFENLSKNILKKMEDEGFDGVSVELPQEFNFGYTQELVEEFLTQIASQTGKGTKYFLMLENMYGERGATLDVKITDAANWIVYHKKGNTSLGDITEKSTKYPNRFLPSADFSEEDWMEGFSDSGYFSDNGKPSRPADLLNWQSDNKGGVAFYHIEKNQLDMSGKVTYKTLRTLIHQLQLKK